MIKTIGVQLYTVRDFMKTEEDIRETFKRLKNLGYDQAQTADIARSGISYEVFGELAKEAGIEIVGTHDDFDVMCNDFDKALERHNALNTQLMGIGGWHFDNSQDVADFIKTANAVAQNAYKHGMKFTYHNHCSEFVRIDADKTIMELLADGLDKDCVSFVLDTFWVQRGGGDVRHWINKLKNRIDILHLKDYAIDNDKNAYFTEIGQGNLYWEGIIEEAEKSGVKYYVVEQDYCEGNPFDCLEISSNYLHKYFM